MGLALSGLASGFDWKSVVDQLIQVSRAPQDRMRKEQATNSAKSSAINQIVGLVSDLKDSLSNLVTADSLYKKSTTFADKSTNWTSSASKDTPAGEYKFQLLSTATASKLTGSTSALTPSLDPTSAISGISVGRTITPGYFTVNGQKITFSSTDTLQSVLDKITATGVSANYDSVSDQIQLSSPSPISLGAPNDTSNFLQAMRLSGSGTQSGAFYELSSAAPKLSAPKLNVPLNSSDLSGLTPVAAGVEETLIINGESIAYKSTDTIQDVLNRINSSKAGVYASYDLASGGFSLTNKTTGNVAITVSDTGSGTLGAALGLVGTGTLSQGSDATFSINGGGILTSRSNTLDETAHGIKGLTVAANSIGSQSLTVASDTTAAKSSLNDFITKYNAVQNAIDKYTKVSVDGTKVTAAIFAGDTQLSSLSRSLRTMLYQSGNGITGSVQRLSDLGINFAGIEPTISLTKSAALDSKLSTAPEDIKEYFSSADNGLIDRLDNFLQGFVSDSGSAAGGFKARLDSITKQNSSLDQQIADVDRRLTQQRSLLESSFIAMESAQSKFQQQSSYLSKTFSNGN